MFLVLFMLLFHQIQSETLKSFSINGGFNMAALINEPKSKLGDGWYHFDDVWGGHIGVSFKDINLDDKLLIEPGIRYIGKGFSHKYLGIEKYYEEFHTTYIDYFIRVKHHNFSSDFTTWAPYYGLFYSTLSGSKSINFEEHLWPYTKYQYSFTDQDFGILFGVDFYPRQSWLLGFELTVGFSQALEHESVLHRGLLITIGHLINLKQIQQAK